MDDDPADLVFVLTMDDLSRATGLHPQLIESFMELGLLEPLPAEAETESLRFAAEAVDRLRRIARLRHDLGVNLAGVAVILEMRDRMEDLVREVEHLRRRLGLED